MYTIFFSSSPAPGNAGNDTGIPRSVGTYGYCWASSFCDADDHHRSLYLGFDTQYLGPCDAYYRSYGFQLRCLSE